MAVGSGRLVTILILREMVDILDSSTFEQVKARYDEGFLGQQIVI
jgi:hypothetical protein